MTRNEEKVNMLFETSWEVCNKVGGIYTVLSTKASTLHKLYGDNVIFIGPDVWTAENPSPDFVPTPTALRQWQKEAACKLEFKVRVGRWNIPGKPRVILVDFAPLFKRKDAIYGEVWERFGVDSLHAYGDYDEACMFSVAAAKVVESIVKWMEQNGQKVSSIAHFDEWTTGMGLLYTKAHLPQAGTVFTAHATCMGRSICGNGKPLYDYLPGYNGDQMAFELNMQSKHSLEKTAANRADCFTTVSKVTGIESGQLLNRVPDVVTPNGFEASFVPTGKKYDEARAVARERLLDVASHLIGERLAANSFLVLTSGRHEFRNKGIDLFIDAINKLRTDRAGKQRKVVAFIMVPGWCNGPRADLQHELKLKGCHRLPNECMTHGLHNYDSDAIYGKLNYLGMHNALHENVYIIYTPCYLNGDDGIFNLSYYNLLPGFDASAFPSYYEPWGYTPLESIAFGVPTITTSLSGFGQWVLDTAVNDLISTGVKVLQRSDSNYSHVVDDLARCINYLADLSQDQILRARASSLDTAERAAWSQFISHYQNAYAIALEAARRRR